MSVQPVERAPASTAAPTSALILATAAAYAAEQEEARTELVTAALLIWANLDTKNPVQSWIGGIGQRIYVLLSILQEMIARDANAYTRRVLADQGLMYLGPDIRPLNFAGIASDGRDLESLLAGAVIQVRKAQREGRSDPEARQRGENWLRLVLNTQVTDAARAAESVSLTVAEPVKPDDPKRKVVNVGWVRMLTPPSCGRCAILAGKFYKYNQGFQRHPNCDCHHIPTTLAGSEALLTDPSAYFNSLTEAEQNLYFGKSQAQAIRDGADPAQVINATNTKGAVYRADDGRRYTTVGTTRRGLSRQRSGEVLRPTPWQIYDDTSSREEAIEMLRRYGYIV